MDLAILTKLKLTFLTFFGVSILSSYRTAIHIQPEGRIGILAYKILEYIILNSRNLTSFYEMTVP